MEYKQDENSNVSTENPKADRCTCGGTLQEIEIKQIVGTAIIRLCVKCHKKALVRKVEDEAAGKENDQGKLPYELLPFSVIDGIVAVQRFGAAKYGPNNWQRVAKGKTRYIAAALRHISAVQQGQRYDEESGLPHLAHALCSLMYAQWIDQQHLKRHGKCATKTQ